MEKVLGRDASLMGAVWPLAAILVLACAMIVVAYGMDSVAPGVHDAFHDFRHAFGMPCH